MSNKSDFVLQSLQGVSIKKDVAFRRNELSFFLFQLFFSALLKIRPSFEGDFFKPIIAKEPALTRMMATKTDKKFTKSGIERLISFVWEINLSDWTPYDFSYLHETLVGYRTESQDEKLLLIRDRFLRKKGGVFFTPDSLVQLMLDTTLEPIASGKRRLHGASILDPACGAGVFLTGAFDRLRGKHNYTSRDAIQLLCGTDINYASVWISKFNLFALYLKNRPKAEENIALPYIDHHFAVGNSLIGTTAQQISGGVRTENIKAIGRDNKKITAELRKKNRSEREILSVDITRMTNNRLFVSRLFSALNAIPQQTTTDVQNALRLHYSIVSTRQYQELLWLYNLHTALFFWPKSADTLKEDAPDLDWHSVKSNFVTHELFCQYAKKPFKMPEVVAKLVHNISKKYAFIHWELAFPRNIAM